MPGGSNPTASKKRSRKAPVETTPPRATRSRHAAAVAETKALAQRVLSSPDIVHLILPQLGLREFVSLRGTCSEIKGATQTVCEDLIQILERASHLYISPQFADGLRLIAAHQPHVCWLLQSPVLAVVAIDRYDQLIQDAYHLLQAHLSRLQKLAVSRSLRRTAMVLAARASHAHAATTGKWGSSAALAAAAKAAGASSSAQAAGSSSSSAFSPAQAGLIAKEAKSGPRAVAAKLVSARFRLLHLGVRLGMFTEDPNNLKELREAAEEAVDGLTEYHRWESTQPPETAAAHYTLAGFFTYHHRRDELQGHALSRAHTHLDAALRIQNKELGNLHVATLCSQLVKAQVMLLQQNNMPGCGLLLKSQLEYCTRALSGEHPLAAKMLAVQARLKLKLGETDECELLQQRVLKMRRAALGLHHEDTHRSAMDVYSRRRDSIRPDVPLAPQQCSGLAEAIEICLMMLEKAAMSESGLHGYVLSKSLQGMAQSVFLDLYEFARRKMLLWNREKTLTWLSTAADTLERLPIILHDHHPTMQDAMHAAVAEAAQDAIQDGADPAIVAEVAAAGAAAAGEDVEAVVAAAQAGVAAAGVPGALHVAGGVVAPVLPPGGAVAGGGGAVLEGPNANVVMDGAMVEMADVQEEGGPVSEELKRKAQLVEKLRELHSEFSGLSRWHVEEGRVLGSPERPGGES